MRWCILHGWVSWSILSSSIYWVRKSNFHVTKNTYVDVDVDKINIILCTSRYIEMDEDDEIDLDFNEKDDVRHDDKNEE